MNARARTTLFAVCTLLVILSSENLFAGVGNWTSSGPDGAVVIALAAHPSNPSTIYAAASQRLYTSQRLYKSVDAGASWAPTGLSGRFDLVVLPTSEASVAYATTTDQFAYVSPSRPAIREGVRRIGSWVA